MSRGATGWGRSGAAGGRGVALAATALAALFASTPARAEESARWGRRTTAPVSPSVVPPSGAPTEADGVYGRFDGDLELSLGAGAALDPDATRGALALGLHYFSVAGVTLTASDALGRSVAGDARVLGLAVDLRPGFVPRWAQGMQRGPAFLDLFIDSISLSLGAWWAGLDGGALGERRGLEASLGFGLPLTGRAPGPWLEARGALRWPDAAVAGPTEVVPGALLLVSWHLFMVSPLARDPSLL